MENHLSNSNFSQQELNISQSIPVYLTKVYNWMAIALLLTGLAAYFTAGSEKLIQIIFLYKILLCLLIISSFSLFVYFAARI